MAGSDKTEKATPRKRQDVRKKGQVAKSTEINAAANLLAAILAIKWFASSFAGNWQTYASQHFRAMSTLALVDSTKSEMITQVVREAGEHFLLFIMPMLTLLLAVGLLSNMVQTGFMLAPGALAIDFNRVNPAQGFQRMFSIRSVAELLKSSGKALLVSWVSYGFFRSHAQDLLGLISTYPTQVGPMIISLLTGLMLRVVGVLLVIAVADYAFQWWQFEKNIRMTKQEIKEEYKLTEGDPLMKSRIRQRQRELTRRRMMADVAKATAVITNPTHYAIALKYEPGVTPAPRVVGKGQRLIAQQIKLIARQHGIPVIENRPLAQELFARCEIGDYIPSELYQAVAEIIAFVYKQARQSARAGAR